MATAQEQFEALSPEQQAEFTSKYGDTAQFQEQITVPSAQTEPVMAPEQHQTAQTLVQTATETQMPAAQEQQPIQPPAEIANDPKMLEQFAQITRDQQEKLISQLEAKRAKEAAPIEEVKVKDIVPKFGYETTLLERQDRNQSIAEKFFQQDKKDININKIADEISILAPDVTSEEVQNTVNDIKSRFDKLKMTNELRTIDNDTIAQNIATGQMSIDDIDGLKIQDPEKYEAIIGIVSEKNQLSVNNDRLSTFTSMFGDERIETSLNFLNDLNAKFTSALQATDGQESLAKYKEALNDPELMENKDELAKKQ